MSPGISDDFHHPLITYFLRDFPIGKCQNTQSFHGKKALILLLDRYFICRCYFENTIMCQICSVSPEAGQAPFTIIRFSPSIRWSVDIILRSLSNGTSPLWDRVISYACGSRSVLACQMNQCRLCRISDFHHRFSLVESLHKILQSIRNLCARSSDQVQIPGFSFLPHSNLQPSFYSVCKCSCLIRTDDETLPRPSTAWFANDSMFSCHLLRTKRKNNCHDRT